MVSGLALLFELYALLEPEMITIDPFELFKSRGGLFLQAFCGPTGFLGSSRSQYAAHHLHRKRRGGWSELMLQSTTVAQAWSRFIASLFWKTASSNIHRMELLPFSVVWESVMPEPHRSDMGRAREIEQLFKYYKTFRSFGEASPSFYAQEKDWST